MAREMNWTTNKPTKPGIYWHCSLSSPVNVVRVRLSGNAIEYVALGTYEYWEPLLEGDEDEWQGPIEPSEEG